MRRAAAEAVLRASPLAGGAGASARASAPPRGAARRLQVRWLHLDPPELLAQKVVAGDRRSLSRAITLVESGNPQHARLADEVQQLVQEQSRGRRCVRVGVSGPPGTGKSCFIEALGCHLTGLGKKVVVLAVDPSSKVSGGSLLGDKTRMERLSVDPLAYIRPSPTGGSLGGLAEATHETLMLCEGAGWEVALVETVGVGQSETDAKGLTDCFVLLLPPSAGDELQGMKKGIVEVADIICITKDDGATRDLARQAQQEYRKALQLVCPHGRSGGGWRPPVLRCSAHEGTGIAEAWAAVTSFLEQQAAEIEARRSASRQERMWAAIRRDMLRRIETDTALAAELAQEERAVLSGAVVPRLAARRFLDHWIGAQMGSAQPAAAGRG